jgi:hypothetical protein
MDNVLFGRIAHQQADAPERIHVLMRDLFDRLGCRTACSPSGSTSMSAPAASG